MLRRRLLSLVILAFAAIAPASAQPATQQGKSDPTAKKVLTLADYGRWNRVANAALSGDGKWMTYAYTPNEGDGTLFIKELDGQKVYTIPMGSGAQFSDDSRWAAYFVTPSTTGRGGRGNAGRGNAPPPATPPATPPVAGRGGAPEPAANRTFELLDLSTGTQTSTPGIASFRFANGSRWLSVRANKPAGQTNNGVTVVIRDLSTGAVSQTFGNVGEGDFNDASKLFAYTVDAGDKMANGIYVYDLDRNTSAPLITGSFDFDNLAWRPRSSDLVALRGDKKKGFVQRDNSLLVFTSVGDASRTMAVIDSANPGMKAPSMTGMVLSELSAPRWSRDGSKIFFGVKEQEPEVPATTEPKANVDVWHWKDDNVQSVQIIQIAQARRATTSAVYDVKAARFLVLGDSNMRTVTPTPNAKWAIGRVDTSYSGAVEWGTSKGDFYRIDVVTGKRTLIERGLNRTMGVSPDSKWYLYLKNKKIIAYNIEAGTSTTLAVPGVSFVDDDDDHPYEKPVYGIAGWARDGRVILDHKFDLWAVPLDGTKATNLTAGVGTAEQIRFRLANLSGGGGRGGRGGGGASADTSDDLGIDLSQPQTLSAYGEWTKKSGYYRLMPGGAKPQPLIFEDKSIGGAAKAARADRVIITEQTATEFPDYHVTTTAFASPKKVTDANPFITEYAWTPKRTLIDYKNSKGQRLQGTLTLPANYEPGKKYPMLVYFYEKMSDTHHTFSMPVYDDRPHMSTYASDGYLVFQPDVVYEIGKPGSSALDCVTSGVKEVIKLGYADPKHIGLQGHSWGGYQSSFILTQTDMFAAVVTGAPPTDLASFYDETYPGSGTLQQGIMEVGQVRMGEGATPWTARELYDSQSPIFFVRNIKTPFMILQGTADNAVDWHQGLEFYGAARRWGKQVIFLSYPGEPHHLARKENQKDFQIRMKTFFDHYLKGGEAPKWMTDGIPQTKKGTGM